MLILSKFNCIFLKQTSYGDAQFKEDVELLKNVADSIERK
ncbi:hypothetical protein METSMIF1_03372 [Methanobrevibacter smithii DSM 2374]|uniref:Uncharacterized protein n=1 Tax=Methanobrevibacter smithii DSM 2374 TaxID=521002 RepID=D2ZR89_METSM|nr:hypothetical protein METSMIF1_03372 [Methanobrevibacter smithii DSM 2374]